MFTFLYGEMQDGYVSLDADMAETLESAYSQITNARKQLQSDDYTRMLVYLNLPVGGDETYDFLDQMRVVAHKYYPDGEVYVVGDSSSEQDFKTSFSRDNVVVSVLSILIVLVVLLFTFKSAGIPVLLIVVIQGSIWINYGIPTITNSPLFFLSYLVVSSIQMGANIDYAIVTTSRFMEFKDKMPKKDAIIETMNMSFPTIITSGLMMAIAGILIGQMTSNAAIAGIGDSLGRGTILTIFIVMFILPQILLLGEKVIDKTCVRYALCCLRISLRDACASMVWCAEKSMVRSAALSTQSWRETSISVCSPARPNQRLRRRSPARRKYRWAQRKRRMQSMNNHRMPRARVTAPAAHGLHCASRSFRQRGSRQCADRLSGLCGRFCRVCEKTAPSIPGRRAKPLSCAPTFRSPAWTLRPQPPSAARLRARAHHLRFQSHAKCQPGRTVRHDSARRTRGGKPECCGLCSCGRRQDRLRRHRGRKLRQNRLLHVHRHGAGRHADRRHRGPQSGLRADCQLLV